MRRQSKVRTLVPRGISVAVDAHSYDAWFRAKVQEALDDPSPTTPHAKAMQDAQALIEAGRQQKF
jgi:DNA-damage-inducible protein J